jgi:hypothetical protein
MAKAGPTGVHAEVLQTIGGTVLGGAAAELVQLKKELFQVFKPRDETNVTAPEEKHHPEHTLSLLVQELLLIAASTAVLNTNMLLPKAWAPKKLPVVLL